MVIDRDGTSFGKLSSETFSGFRVEGDASEPAVLRKAKIDQADLVITATHADNVNLMVALGAKRVFGVQHVMARVYDPAQVWGVDAGRAEISASNGVVGR